MTKYEGPLRPKLMPLLVRKAYQAWFSQRERCRSPKHASYKYYGAKGVKVKYEAREFINWYLAEHSKKIFSRPSVGRIDHSKDYEFGNIEIIERGENTREMLRRTGGNKCGDPTVLVFEDKTLVFCSLGKAAKHLGCGHATLQDRLSAKGPARRGNRKFPCDVYHMDDFLRGV